MNKKKLLLVLLTLAIVTSLSAGTLAIYSSSAPEMSTNVQAKRFLFNTSDTIVDGDNEIKLAPGESMTYKFTVTNASTNNGTTTAAEVTLDYTASINFAGAVNTMTGLTPTFSLKVNGVTADCNISGDAGVYTITGSLPANTATEDEYTLVLEWNDDGTASTTQAGIGEAAAVNTLTVQVTAQQHVAS